MALTDICFQEQEGQAFILEIPLGSLNAASDIALEPNGSQYTVQEIENGTNIFIMSE